MRLPDKIRLQFREFGRQGGRRRAENLAPSQRAAIARRAAVCRWLRERFGTAQLTDIGFPGAEFIDSGLRDLAMGEVTTMACLIALAAPRLRRNNIPVPTISENWKQKVPDPYFKLYELLEAQSGELAHTRYNAHLQQVASFAATVESLPAIGSKRPQ